MGAFFILRTDDGQAPADLRQRCLAHFEAAGFGQPQEIAANGWHVTVYSKLQGGAPQVHFIDNDNFAFATGTLIYKRKYGAAALAEIFAEFDGSEFDPRDLHGAFALGVCKSGKFTLSTDLLGVYHVYRDQAWSVISSSFLAVLATVDRPKLSKQGVYEYVFQAATYGPKTLVDQILSFDCHNYVELGEMIRFRLMPEIHHPDRESGTFEEHLERSLTVLRNWFCDVVACFGHNIDTALSAGYDSRLILALLREQGILPRVHVYGAAGDSDVEIAKRIAAGERIPILHVDKRVKGPPDPDDFADIVARNCLAFDGLPADGILDNGTDLATRTERAAGGALALNGGGGEIFRNFFYLPDRPYSIKHFIWTFYSQYDPDACTEEFSERKYRKGLAGAICHALGRNVEILDRRDIEFLYAGFRCAYWMGSNNSTNNRFGYFLTPFVEHHVVAAALKIPIQFKNHGRFEAELIRAAGPLLAQYPSAYGHDFVGPIPFSHQLKDWLTILRPPWMRRYSFRIKTRLSPTPRPPLLRNGYISRVIDPAFPLLSKYLKPDRLRDNAQFARACTLEYLLARYNVRL